ncbi:MAG: hypothetical protein H0Z19_01635 [Archaeoglobus sp.]|uniref:hypothetical protein n=1 Tax=Archaeoglobus sp. TaxID=1872626 RepID=UPI001DA30CC8|nr:hypothetical protein [Archaeoglobus sp.]MBO8179176.1 hypothetical protein [Archaeoglobus sp.]
MLEIAFGDLSEETGVNSEASLQKADHTIMRKAAKRGCPAMVNKMQRDVADRLEKDNRKCGVTAWHQ